MHRTLYNIQVQTILSDILLQLIDNLVLISQSLPNIPWIQQLLHSEFRVLYQRGGVGFHSWGPALTTGCQGYFGGDPHPAPTRGKSPLIPWIRHHFTPTVLTGTGLGNRTGCALSRSQNTQRTRPSLGRSLGYRRELGWGPRVSEPWRPCNER